MDKDTKLRLVSMLLRLTSFIAVDIAVISVFDKIVPLEELSPVQQLVVGLGEGIVGSMIAYHSAIYMDDFVFGNGIANFAFREDIQ